MKRNFETGAGIAFCGLAGAACLALLVVLVGRGFGHLSVDELVFLSRLDTFAPNSAEPGSLEIGFFTPYFRALSPFMPQPLLWQDLPLVAFWLGALPLLLLAAIAAVLWRGQSLSFAGLLTAAALLLLFATIGRVVEIRPDAIAIPLITLAWVRALTALRAEAKRNAYLGPLALLILASLIAPRALMFVALSAPLCVALARTALGLSWRQILITAIGVLAVYGLLAALFFADVQASLSSGLFGRAFSQDEKLTLYQRFVFAHRGIFCGIYAVTICFAAAALRRGADSPYGTACLWAAFGLSVTQLVALYIDARAYEYAYSYGMAGPLAFVMWLAHAPARQRWYHPAAAAIVMAWQVLLVVATNVAGLNVSWIHALPSRLPPPAGQQQTLAEVLPDLVSYQDLPQDQQIERRRGVCALAGPSLILAPERYNPFCDTGGVTTSFDATVFAGGAADIPPQALRQVDGLLTGQNEGAPVRAIIWGRPGSAPGPFLDSYLQQGGWQQFDGFALRP